MATYENEMEEMFKRYTDQVKRYALHIYIYEVNPWLEKYHLEFLAGNGTCYVGYTPETPDWYIRKYRVYYKESSPGHGQIDQDKLGKMGELLNSNIPGFPANSFGSFMPSSVEEAVNYDGVL